MPNRIGQAYGLTAFCPIRAGHEAGLRGVLSGLPNGGESFLATGKTHLARLVTIDKLAEPKGTKAGGLKSSYLLFTSNFDGADAGTPLATYLGDLFRGHAQVIFDVWQHCVAFPDPPTADSFVEYIQSCQIKTTFFFVDYGRDTTVEQALQALSVQQDFVAFATQAQQLSAEELHTRFGDFMEETRNKPTPKSGTL